MPFRRRRFVRKFRPRRRFYRRRRFFRPRPEKKVSTSTLHTNFGSIGSIWIEQDLLAPIIAGTSSFSERIGRKISVASVQIKGVLFGGAQGSLGADDYFNSIRLCVLGFHQDKSGSAITPLSSSGLTISSVIQATNCPGLSSSVS